MGEKTYHGDYSAVTERLLPRNKLVTEPFGHDAPARPVNDTGGDDCNADQTIPSQGMVNERRRAFKGEGIIQVVRQRRRVSNTILRPEEGRNDHYGNESYTGVPITWSFRTYKMSPPLGKIRPSATKLLTYDSVCKDTDH